MKYKLKFVVCWGLLYLVIGCSTMFTPKTKINNQKKVNISTTNSTTPPPHTKPTINKNKIIKEEPLSVATGYMDKHEQELKKAFKKTEVKIKRQNHNIKIIMPGNAVFETNSSYVKSSFFGPLSKLATLVNTYSNTRIKINGFTDNTGGFAHNQLLSEDRARSVSAYLIHNGVNNARLYVKGLGERYPFASNDTKEGRRLNRRVELTIEPVNY